MVLAAAVIAAIGFLLPLMPQPQWYHMFAAAFFGIPHFNDVVSISLRRGCVVGTHVLAEAVASGISWTIGGLAVLDRLRGTTSDRVWVLLRSLATEQREGGVDRLAMTLVFYSLLAAIVAERIGPWAGLWLMPLLLLIGVVSVLQCRVNELRGAGDLRFYAAVQLYAVLFLLIAPLLPSGYTRGRDLAIVAGFYVLAKILEVLDRPIFELGHIASGHTLKHLAAACAGYWILRMLLKRRPEEAIHAGQRRAEQPSSAAEEPPGEFASRNVGRYRPLAPRY